MASTGAAEVSAQKLILYRFVAPDQNTYCTSNTNTKLETVFRMSNVKYDLASGNPFTAPKGKLPYVQFENGEKMGDSNLIYKHLVATNQIKDLDADLSPLEKLHADSFRIFIEEWAHWLRLWDIWTLNFYESRSFMFNQAGITSYPLQVILGWYSRRRHRNSFYLQGLGRHSEAEIERFIIEAVEMMAVFVREETRLADPERPCLVQATLFGFLLTTYLVKEVSRVFVKELEKRPELGTWTVKMASKYYPERKFPS